MRNYLDRHMTWVFILIQNQKNGCEKYFLSNDKNDCDISLQSDVCVSSQFPSTGLTRVEVKVVQKSEITLYKLGNILNLHFDHCIT